MKNIKNFYLKKIFLTPTENCIRFLKGICENNRVVNLGPLVQRLASTLKEYLGFKILSFVATRTKAMQIVIRSLDLQEEILTPPFSYDATTSSIIWGGSQPKFVDINHDSPTINPDIITSSINSKTIARLSTNTLGYPCHPEIISDIARSEQLSMIDDTVQSSKVRYYKKSFLYCLRIFSVSHLKMLCRYVYYCPVLKSWLYLSLCNTCKSVYFQ